MARLWPFWRQNQSQLPSPATQFNQPTRRRWPVIAASVLAALVLVGLAVLAGLLIYNAVHKEPTKKQNVAQNNQSKSQTTSPKPGTTKKPSTSSATSPGAGTTSGTSGSTSTTGGTATKGTTTPSTSGQVGKTLPNNGPGDVLALFAGSSLAAAGLHYILSLRREN